LNGAVYKIADTTIKKFDPENMGIAAKILFLSALEPGIPQRGKNNPLFTMNVCKNRFTIEGLNF